MKVYSSVLITMIILILFVVFLPCSFANDSSVVNGLFSPQERRNAGLHKLSSDELKALDAAIMRVFIQLNSTRQDASDNLDFYDKNGKAVAYIEPDEELTIYLWSGKPVAYLDEDSVFGFNGKHLGWLKDGTIYDHDGDIVATLADRFSKTPPSPPPKGFKEFKPFKGFKEFEPFEPFFGMSWSGMPVKIFFLQGSK